VLNDATIPCLRCRIVCGGANNQLAEVRHDAALAVRGIVFVPDYLANAGGVIDFHQETIDDRPDAVLASVAHRRHYSRRLALRRRDRHHPVDHRGSHSPGADPAGQRRPGADPVNGVPKTP
jgi:leucine dehydrogenase